MFFKVPDVVFHDSSILSGLAEGRRKGGGRAAQIEVLFWGENFGVSGGGAAEGRQRGGGGAQGQPSQARCRKSGAFENWEIMYSKLVKLHSICAARKASA